MVDKKPKILLRKNATIMASTILQKVNSLPPSVQPIIMAYAQSCLLLALGSERNFKNFLNGPQKSVTGQELNIYKTCVNMTEARKTLHSSYKEAFKDEYTSNFIKNFIIARMAGYDLAIITLTASINRFSMPETINLWKKLPIPPGGNVSRIETYLGKYEKETSKSFFQDNMRITLKELCKRPGFTQ